MSETQPAEVKASTEGGGIAGLLGDKGGALALGGGAALGGGIVAMMGRLGQMGSRGLATWARRTYTCKLEIPCTDLSYSWMLEHLARRNDFSSHISLLTQAEVNNNQVRDIKYRYKPAPGQHILWDGWIPIKIERTRERPTASQEPYETIVIESFQRNKADGRARMERLINKAREEAKLDMEENSTIQVYGTNGQEWHVISTQPRRPLVSVVLDEGERERILNDMVAFNNNRKFYGDMGIPYRRGYLFYGSPGSGKSSLITALAAELQYSICQINMADKLMDDTRFLHLISKAPPNSLIVLEDIDCAFRDRRKEIEGDPRYIGASGGVTHSGLLNAIDGVTNSDGRIVIMTTNYKDQLDPALIRPGRVDLQIELGDASDRQICGIYLKFFSKAPDEFAWNFCRSVRSYCDSISMARLQGYLMVQQDALVAIQQCHLLADDETTLDLHGTTQQHSKPLTMEDLSEFIQT